MNDLMWWGYLHQNGSIQLKRWWGDHKDYTDDCYDNEFVQRVVKPFKANDQKEAFNILKTCLGLNTSIDDSPK
jgi:hypothetical protein